MPVDRMGGQWKDSRPEADARAATIGPVPWPVGDMGEDGKEALMFRQAITPADWDTVEGHGGLGVVMERVVQWERETPASDARERIDDFSLAGSRTWRRRGVHLTKRGWHTEVAHQVAHAFDHRNASLSEGKALAVVVQAVPGNPHWTRVGTDCPRRLRQPWRGSGWRVPASSGAPRLEGEEVVRATPWFSALVRHRAGGGGALENSHHLPSPAGVALTTVIPGGKANERFFALTVGVCPPV